MNLLKKLFGGNSETPAKSHEKKEVMVNISSVTNSDIPPNAEIVAESQIPAFCSIGNLVYEKKYHEAIELGEKLLTETPDSAGVHVNLMDAYFKVRDENTEFYDKHINHARLAMRFGHNTGYVQKKLAIGLEKQNKIYQAIQICDIVLDEKFHFSKHGCGSKDEFLKRKERLLKKVNKSTDNKTSEIFTNDEISSIIKHIQQEEERIKQEAIAHEKKMEQMRKNLGI
ncbi:MAG: hypothetical protein JXL97_19380 [Bacteroidales bacterium]|nr:hypothetical protein [Bacteroidales bacterium]